jgi:hypothetical protein
MIDTETTQDFGLDLDNFPVLEFTAHDRCDGCGSRAYTIAQHTEHSELLFCFHHRNELVKALEEEGWVLTDDEEGIARDLFPKQFEDAGV